MNAAPNKVAFAAAASNYSYPWIPDCGDGTYRNPVLYADYSDPDVIRHGDDFWMTSSSFNCTPGLPILHSRDLVNWKLVNHALKNVPGERYNEVQHGCGVWAPSLRFHAGKFWIFFPTPDEGIFVITADDPRGCWSEPHLVQAGKGLIDPCPLWDDDRKAYLVHAYAHSRSGMKHKLRVVPMSPDGAHLLGEGQIVFHEPDRHHTIEGPKFLKRDGWYYILAPAGGVTTGWQTALRSRNIFGTYEDRIVLEQGRTKVNGPHQGALVDTADGEWWFLHFQDTGVYGRVVHLQPVRWKEGWPLMGADGPNKIGEPVLEYQKPALPKAEPEAQPASDEFTSSRLGLQWQWNANHQDGWHSLTARPGWLRLFSQAAPDGNLAQAPHLLLQKFPAREFTVETRLEFNSAAKNAEAGLVVMGNEYAAIAIAQSCDDRHIIYRQNGKAARLKALHKSSVSFRVKVQDGGICEFAYACNDDEFTIVTSLFQARAGAWIGARVGLYSSCSSPVNGHADFDYFRLLPQISNSQR